MIDPENAWKSIKENAHKALITETHWHSLVDKAPYKLVRIECDLIVIARLNGGADEELTANNILKAAKKFNELYCKVKRRTLISPTVAKETAFVFFHPSLTWDENGEFIIEITP